MTTIAQGSRHFSSHQTATNPQADFISVFPVIFAANEIFCVHTKFLSPVHILSPLRRQPGVYARHAANCDRNIQSRGSSTFRRCLFPFLQLLMLRCTYPVSTCRKNSGSKTAGCFSTIQLAKRLLCFPKVLFYLATAKARLSNTSVF
jgi:hypothetical protein